ncbi:MAG: GGDEF domain-containing protein [Clostridia bacterium]|nr:GGDEF domain-containing protein [Clostridia bacterium]
MKKLLREKIFTFATVLLVIGMVFSVPAFFMYNKIEDMVMTETNKQAGTLAISVAKYIEQNVEEYEKLSFAAGNLSLGYNMDHYKKMSGLLRDIKMETGAKFIYTEKRLSKEKIAYVLDAEDPSSEDHSPFGSEESISDLEKKAFKTKKGSVSGLVEYEEWGKLISAYAPITNKTTGETIGLAGVDYSPVYVNNVMTGIRVLIITGLLGAILLAGAAVNFLLSARQKSINTDYMTRLYNKCFFDICIKGAVNEASKHGRPFSLIVIDIDDFKDVNDRFGHLTGDEVLKVIASTIKKCTRDDDLCFRYGGDEFVIILPNTTKEQAGSIGQRIQSRLLSDGLGSEDMSEIRVSLSIGIAQWEPGVSASDLTEWADKAMYSSKNKGKNQMTLSSNEK